MKKTGLIGSVRDFSADYGDITVNDILSQVFNEKEWHNKTTSLTY